MGRYAQLSHLNPALQENKESQDSIQRHVMIYEHTMYSTCTVASFPGPTPQLLLHNVQ